MARSVAKSNYGHSRAVAILDGKRNTVDNKARRNYHADCSHQQEHLGRVLSKSEKKKLFSWWNKYEHDHDSAGCYPSFEKK